MKLTYWVSEIGNDHNCYNIRARTKRECQAMRDEMKSEGSNYYGPVHKVTVEYKDGFDLLIDCLGEGGIYEGDRS